jgi:hypothetical protein
MMQYVYPNSYNFYHNGKKAIDYYNGQVTSRREKYALPYVDGEQKYQSEVEQLNENGFVVFKQAVDHNILDKILQKTNKIIEEEKYLKSHDEHYAMVGDPFIHVPEVQEIAFSDQLVEFATEYFNCIPALGTFNLRRSYVNDLPPKSTQLFHCDRNSIKFFKFFMYLNDVDSVEDGPLTLIKESNKKRPFNHSYQHRWTEENMRAVYGDNSLVYLTAKKGDLIAANPGLFYHRGTKPTSKERTMLTLNYVIHEELQGGQPSAPSKWFKIKQEQYDKLPDWKKPIADFLVKV